MYRNPSCQWHLLTRRVPLQHAFTIAKTLPLSLRKNHHRNFALSFEFSFCRIVLRYHSNKVIAMSFSGRVGCLNLMVWLVVNFWTSRQLNSFNPWMYVPFNFLSPQIEFSYLYGTTVQLRVNVRVFTPSHLDCPSDALTQLEALSVAGLTCYTCVNVSDNQVSTTPLNVPLRVP